MHAKLVHVVSFQYRVAVELPAITHIPSLRIWVAVVRVHQAASGPVIEFSAGGRDHGQRIYAETPVGEFNAGARNGISIWITRTCAGKREHRLKHRWVRLLNHEDGNIFEYLTIVDP